MDNFRIDRLGPDDWSRHRTIRLRALTTDPDSFGSTLQREQNRTNEVWRQRLAESVAAIFVAHDNELGDVGLAAGAPFSDREGAGLFSMWVAPEARGKGYAKALIESVVRWATEKGYKQLRLEVGDENQAAIELYTQMGFEPTGHTSHLDPPRERITEHERLRELD